MLPLSYCIDQMKLLIFNQCSLVCPVSDHGPVKPPVSSLV